MKKIVKLTETDLIRLVKRVINEQTISPINYHRFRDGGNPGIEDFFKTPTNDSIARELENQLETDPYAKNTKTNIGKGTRKMMILFNAKRMTPEQFINQVQEDANENKCHTIVDYQYDNKIIGKTLITIDTKIGECKKDKVPTPTPKKPCKYTIPNNFIKSNMDTVEKIKTFQGWCKNNKLYYAEYTDNTKKTCSEIDGKIGCCTATCYKKLQEMKLR